MINTIIKQNPYKISTVVGISTFIILTIGAIFFEIEFRKGEDFSFSLRNCGEGEKCFDILIPIMIQFNVPLGIVFLTGLISIITALFASFFSFSLIKNLLEKELNISNILKEENILCYYQPIIDLKNYKIVGCEVLMRLKFEETLYMPDEVIPLIMKNNLSWELTENIIKKSFKELKDLNIKDNFKIAYNLTATDVQADRIDFLVKQINKPKNFKINLEITEHEALSYEYTITELKELQKKGYLISVDDFGQGYSNFSALKKINPDILKIDKSFIFELAEEDSKDSFVSSIVDIAKKTDAKIVAEGIETANVLRKLKKMDIDYGQGYYYSKPIPIEEFKNYLMTYDLI